MVARAHGHDPEQTVIGTPLIFLCKPHQGERGGRTLTWLPNVTATWNKKRAAIKCLAGQGRLWQYHARINLNRDNQVARNSERKAPCGEGAEAMFLHVTDTLA